jgi:hypothetical protein
MADQSNRLSGQKKPLENKKEAVSRALSRLGKNAMPVDIQKYLRSEYGIEMTTSHISVYKTEIMRNAAKKGSSSSKPAAPQQSAAKKVSTPVSAKPVAHSNGKPTGISLKAIETMKSLVSQVGERDLKTLIELLGK